MFTPMPPDDLFLTTARTWHDYYFMMGGSAATLIGLMFVAVTFGAGLVSSASPEAARAFIDPTLSHFVQVLGTSGFFLMPTLTARTIGAVLLGGLLFRGGALVWVFGHLRRAHQMHGDMEMSDWLISIVLPAVAYLIIGGGALGFVAGMAGNAAFTAVAVGTGLVMAIGIRSAWELMLWMAIKVNERRGS